MLSVLSVPTVLAALLACSGSDPTTSTSTGTTDDSGDTTTPCDAGVRLGSLVTQTFTHEQFRTYSLYVPEDYDCTPRPLVIGLHGYFGTGEGFATSTAGLEPELADAGAIGVFPDGLPAGNEGYAGYVTSFNDLTSRNDAGPQGPTCTKTAFEYVAYPNCGAKELLRACRWGTSCADDAGFLRNLVRDLQERFTIDPAHIVLTGFSQGGQTAAGLACELDDVVSVVAPIHGSAANGYTCAPDSPTSLVHVVGRTDTVVDSFDRPSEDGMIYDSAAETGAAWAASQGCSDTPTPTKTAFDGSLGWGCETYAGCTSGAEVWVCTWDGGHTWPRQRDGDNPPWALISDLITR